MHRAAEIEFAKLFGLKPTLFDKIFTGQRRCGSFTQKDIASVLTTHGLCNKEDADSAAKYLVGGDCVSISVRFLPVFTYGKEKYYAIWNPYTIPTHLFP